jgi:hypothetical protein
MSASEASMRRARYIVDIVRSCILDDYRINKEAAVRAVAAALDEAKALPDGAQHWKTCVDVNCTHWACKMGHDAVDAYRQLKAQALPGECDCEFGGGSFRQCDRCRALAPAPEQQDAEWPSEEEAIDFAKHLDSDGYFGAMDMYRWLKAWQQNKGEKK